MGTTQYWHTSLAWKGLSLWLCCFQPGVTFKQKACETGVRFLAVQSTTKVTPGRGGCECLPESVEVLGERLPGVDAGHVGQCKLLQLLVTPEYHFLKSHTVHRTLTPASEITDIIADTVWLVTQASEITPIKASKLTTLQSTTSSFLRKNSAIQTFSITIIKYTMSVCFFCS